MGWQTLLQKRLVSEEINKNILVTWSSILILKISIYAEINHVQYDI